MGIIGERRRRERFESSAPKGSARWIFTLHAVERFVQRFAPGLSLEEAHSKLAQAALTAESLGVRIEQAGDILWRVPPLTLVTRQEKGEIYCVTVLGEDRRADPQGESALQLEEDLRRRLQQEKERQRRNLRKTRDLLKENRRLRECLDIAVRGLKAMECLDEAAAALAQIENLDPETPAPNK